ncbi:tetratricopeptide repeat protein [Roseiconus nitratireducens]|nr:tetratricopeptide repeat protein [Roseiconus nitratireducens]
MPVLLEGTAVVIRNDALDRCLEGGAAEFSSIAPNAMSFGDDCLSQASFMSSRDAELFLEKLVLMGLSHDDGDPEVVIVDAHTQSVTPECDWLQLAEYNGNLIANLVGNPSEMVVAPKSWDPESGPELQHMSAEEVQARLEFVRRDERVDVYRDKETGQLLYTARLHETPDELFKNAAETILDHLRHPGQPPPQPEVQEQIREAIGALQQLSATNPDAWRIWFLLGKGWHAVDRPERAIESLRRAQELADPPETSILKELAGLYLEVGQTDEACRVGESSVAVRPDDVELLGNLAVAYLLDGRADLAEKTIRHALKIAPEDRTNGFIAATIDAVIAGRRPVPTTLAELERGGVAASTSTLSWRDRWKRLVRRLLRRR